MINGVTTSYTYNGRDELLTESGAGAPTGGIKQYYDLNGNLVQVKQGGTVTTTYSYDLRNRMIQAAVNGVVIKYTYDQDGLQVKRTIGANTDVYLQDKQNPTGYSQVLEQWRNSALYRSFVIGQSIIAQADGSTMRYLLADGHGDTRALLDATGQAITGQILAYDAYGKVISGQSSILTPIQYAAQWIDDATGLSFNRARWYDLAGRWTQRDPRLSPVGDILNANGRLYCFASPVGQTDASGMFSLPECLIVIGVKTLAFAVRVAPVAKVVFGVADAKEEKRARFDSASFLHPPSSSFRFILHPWRLPRHGHPQHVAPRPGFAGGGLPAGEEVKGALLAHADRPGRQKTLAKPLKTHLCGAEDQFLGAKDSHERAKDQSLGARDPHEAAKDQSFRLYPQPLRL